MINLSKIEPNKICRLYQMYIVFQKELLSFATEKWSYPTITEFANCFIEGHRHAKYYFYIKNNETTVGFISFQIVRSESVIYIEDLYIKPKYRKQGIGYETIKYIDDIAGPDTQIFFYVLKTNYNGELFWNKIAHKFNWKPIENPILTVFLNDNLTPNDLKKHAYIKY